MKRYLILIVTILVLILGVITGCGLIRITPETTPTTKTTLTPKEEVLKFARAVAAVEKDRDELIVEYQDFTKKFLDMPTLEVFKKAEYFVKTHAELRKRILSIATPSLEIKEVHTKYLLGYAAEHKGYLAVQSSLVSADMEKLYDSIKLFFEADTFFLEAMDELDELLSEFGLSWSDVR